jgi:hypothetical protein
MRSRAVPGVLANHGDALSVMKNRMLRGELYIADDAALAADHVRAQELLDAYNATRHAQQHERERLLRSLLGGVGEGVVVQPTFRCDYGTPITIGAGTFVSYDCVMLDVAPITIGSASRSPPVRSFSPSRRRRGVRRSRQGAPRYRRPRPRRSSTEQAGPTDIAQFRCDGAATTPLRRRALRSSGLDRDGWLRHGSCWCLRRAGFTVSLVPKAGRPRSCAAGTSLPADTDVACSRVGAASSDALTTYEINEPSRR